LFAGVARNELANNFHLILDDIAFPRTIVLAVMVYKKKCTNSNSETNHEDKLTHAIDYLSGYTISSLKCGRLVQKILSFNDENTIVTMR